MSASLDAGTATLSNQGGTRSESASDATLTLGPVVALPPGAAEAPPIPSAGFWGLAALAMAMAAAGTLLARRT